MRGRTSHPRLTNYRAAPQALGLLAVRMTLPLWRLAGIPEPICDRPDPILKLAADLLAQQRCLSEEAGARESRRETGYAEWYDGAIEQAVNATLDLLADTYGNRTAWSLANWMEDSNSGSEAAQRGSSWGLAFGSIATDRPSESYISERIPLLAQELIAAAYGPVGMRPREECEQRALATTLSAAEEQILARDPTLVEPGESPLRDVVMELEVTAWRVQARALGDLLSTVLSDDEWQSMKRSLSEWPLGADGPVPQND
jgi:hypothetical protein